MFLKTIKAYLVLMLQWTALVLYMELVSAPFKHKGIFKKGAHVLI